jgi:hypothetical protein
MEVLIQSRLFDGSNMADHQSRNTSVEQDFCFLDCLQEVANGIASTERLFTSMKAEASVLLG